MVNKDYVVNKIIDRVSVNSKFKENYDTNLDDLKKALNKLDNIDIMAVPGETFESSVIGWISFCKMVAEVLEYDEQITVENLKSKFISKIPSDASIKKLDDVISPELLEPKKVDLEYIMSIADETNILEGVDPMYLTEEGLRSLNLIDEDSTSLDCEDINFDQSAIIFVKKNEEIISPFSKTTEIIRINENRYMDLITNEEFTVFVRD